METKKLQKNSSKLGPVVGMERGEDGYKITMLYYNQATSYPCTKEVYDYIDQGRHNCYPNVMELIYAPVFDPCGVVVQLLQVDSYENKEGCLITTNLTFATARMDFPATKESLVVGDFIKIEGDKLMISPDYSQKQSHLAYFECNGQVPTIENGKAISIAPDISVYTWDWSKPKAPPAITGIPEEDYVPGFELGAIEDVNHCYWAWFGSLRGDDSVLDTVCFFVGHLLL